MPTTAPSPDHSFYLALTPDELLQEALQLGTTCWEEEYIKEAAPWIYLTEVSPRVFTSIMEKGRRDWIQWMLKEIHWIATDLAAPNYYTDLFEHPVYDPILCDPCRDEDPIADGWHRTAASIWMQRPLPAIMPRASAQKLGIDTERNQAAAPSIFQGTPQKLSDIDYWEASGPHSEGEYHLFRFPTRAEKRAFAAGIQAAEDPTLRRYHNEEETFTLFYVDISD